MSTPNLPEGWKALTAPDGRPYYANTVNATTQWVFPTMPAAAAAAAAGSAPAAAHAPAPVPVPQVSAPHVSNPHVSYPHASSLPATAPQATAPHAVAPHAAAPHAAPSAAPAPKPMAAGDGRYTLQSLVQATGQRDMGQGFFELERDKLLEINLPGNQFAWIKHGTMISRRGNVKFTRQSTREQGFAKVMKKALTGEGMTFVKCEGRGKVFVADAAKIVSIINLQNQSISVNGNDVLAMSGGLKYDIKLMRGAGAMAGGLFNCRISGSGLLAFTVRLPSFLPPRARRFLCGC